MSEIQISSKRTNRMRIFLLVFFALIIAGAFALYAGMFMNRSETTLQHGHDSPVAISAAALEEQYGIRVTLIGVTAGGGMVDFRFKVIDAEKAEALLDHHESMPQLIPADSKVRLGLPGGAHSPTYVDGKVYYMLYGNAGGIVRPGMPVQVAFGDVVLEPVVAQ